MLPFAYAVVSARWVSSRPGDPRYASPMRVRWLLGVATVVAMSGWTNRARGQDVPVPSPKPSPTPNEAPTPKAPASASTPSTPPDGTDVSDEPEATATDDGEASSPATPSAPPPPTVAPATPPAAPAPPRAAPGYGPPTHGPVAYGPAPGPAVHVHIDADHSEVGLERYFNKGERTQRGWHPVCPAPCDRAVEAPLAADFRFSGGGGRSSGKFQLRPSYAAFDVEVGSHGQWVGGWVAVGVGGASLVAGSIVIATTYPGFAILGGLDSDDIKDRRLAGGILMGAGIAIGVGLGLPLLLTSRTQYELVDQRAWLDLRPDGVAVRF